MLLVGLLLPLLEWRARRAGGVDHLLRLVPVEVAAAYWTVVSAASRPGVVDPDVTVAGAEELVLEVAAVCGGRPPRRASQRRFVAVRRAALGAVAADLAERNEAWRAAMRELDALVAPPEDGPVASSEPLGIGTGWLSVVLLVVLAPAFLLVDLVRGAARALVVLVDGIALRLRTFGDLWVAACRAVVRAVGRAVRSWRALTTAVRDAARTAGGHFVAARALTLRRLRLRVRGGRRGRRASWAPSRSSSR